MSTLAPNRWLQKTGSLPLTNDFPPLSLRHDPARP
jgi:hypothetical protein